MATTDDTTKKQVNAVLDELQAYSDAGNIPKDKFCDLMMRLVDLGETEAVCRAVYCAAPDKFMDALNKIEADKQERKTGNVLSWCPSKD